MGGDLEHWARGVCYSSFYLLLCTLSTINWVSGLCLYLAG